MPLNATEQFFQCSVWILISSIFLMFYPYRPLHSMVTLLIPVVPKFPKFGMGLRFTAIPRRWYFSACGLTGRLSEVGGTCVALQNNTRFLTIPFLTPYELSSPESHWRGGQDGGQGGWLHFLISEHSGK